MQRSSPLCRDHAPWPGAHTGALQRELACLSTSEEDGNRLLSLRLSGEDDRPALPGNCAQLPEKM